MFHSLGVNDQPRMTVAPKYCMCSVYILRNSSSACQFTVLRKSGDMDSGERVQISFLSPGILGAQKLGVPLSLSQLNTSSCSVTVSIFNTFHNKFWSILVQLYQMLQVHLPLDGAGALFFGGVLSSTVGAGCVSFSSLQWNGVFSTLLFLCLFQILGRRGVNEIKVAFYAVQSPAV